MTATPARRAKSLKLEVRWGAYVYAGKRAPYYSLFVAVYGGKRVWAGVSDYYNRVKGSTGLRVKGSSIRKHLEELVKIGLAEKKRESGKSLYRMISDRKVMRLIVYGDVFRGSDGTHPEFVKNVLGVSLRPRTLVTLKVRNVEELEGVTLRRFAGAIYGGFSAKASMIQQRSAINKLQLKKDLVKRHEWEWELFSKALLTIDLIKKHTGKQAELPVNFFYYSTDEVLKYTDDLYLPLSEEERSRVTEEFYSAVRDESLMAEYMKKIPKKVLDEEEWRSNAKVSFEGFSIENVENFIKAYEITGYRFLSPDKYSFEKRSQEVKKVIKDCTFNRVYKKEFSESVAGQFNIISRELFEGEQRILRLRDSLLSKEEEYEVKWLKGSYEEQERFFAALINNSDFAVKHTLKLLNRVSPCYVYSLADEKVHISAYKYGKSYATGYNRRRFLERAGVLKTVKSTTQVLLPSDSAEQVVKTLNSWPTLKKNTYKRKKLSTGQLLTVKETKDVNVAKRETSSNYYSLSYTSVTLPHITYFNSSNFNNSISSTNEGFTHFVVKMLKSSQQSVKAKKHKHYM